ncbi:alpha/beta hydrolase (plasmid) [Shinella sp. H4-D48]|uniref:alpha/beta hydrolase n=1 Tax=Shinella sp. H4-D48 TaxID=2925841 RepID=UPI001F53A3B6|nr:alpha/beta hydrolase [Shinella sp. H4-D48]UNK39964.1 alpha/beta hydrolase [Shinella sp. H4-D48]
MTQLFAGYESQAALDAAYDVESSVPDFTVYARQFMADSAAAEAAIADKQLGVSYGPTLMETLDLYRPSPAPTKAPIFIFVHGGYWKSLTSRVFSMVAPGPVAAGACVVNVTYDLCPTVEIGEIIRQVRAAVAWTYRNAESFGGDPDRIVIGGHSAGGHLTATTLLTDWSRYGLPDDTVKAGFSISGLFDLTPLAESFLQPDLRLTSLSVQDHSPMFNVRKCFAPLALTWGDADPEAFAGQSLRFEAAWKAVGNGASSFVLPNANHFEVLEGFKTSDGRMTRVVMDLFEGKLPG